MGRVNASRVVLGGLLAGVVINVLDAASQLLPVDTISWITDLGLPEPGGGAMATWLVLGFVVGVAAVWLYAAIRPRFGPGPGTAVKAGLFAWVFATAIWSAFYLFGLSSPMGFVMAGVIGLINVLAASWVGAKLYSEAA